MKKGISLITLIITIVVVIILAAVVILALGNNNPIDSARLSTVVNSKTNMEDCISIVASKKIAETEGKEQMSDIVKSIIDESASEVKFTQDGTEKTIYRIAPDEFKSRLGIVVKETPNKDCIWYVDNAGKVYLVFDFMKNVPNYLKESDTTLNKSVKNFVIVLDSALESSIIENIEISKTEDTVGVGEDKNITLDLSKVEGLSYSKWVINESKEKIGVDDESKYPNTVEENSAAISLKSITNPGTYYLHVLVCTNDMKVEKISSAIVVEKKADVWDGSIAEGFASGDGTETNPYIIENCSQFEYMAKSGLTYKDKYIKLNCNLDFDNQKIQNVGQFEGTFDGGGHTFSNMKYTFTGRQNGLFVTNYGTIKNIGMEGNLAFDSKVGTIVGENKGGTIDSCYNAINFEYTEKSGEFGGICYSSTSFNGVFGTIKNCYNVGNYACDVSTNGVSGIVCTIKETNVYNCYNAGNIIVNNSSSYNTAGIVSKTDGNSTIINIKNCYNSGNIKGAYYVGGIVGRLDYIIAEEVYNSGNVEGYGTYKGPIAYEAVNGGKVINSYYLSTSCTGGYIKNLGSPVENMPKTIIEVVNGDNAFKEDTKNVNNGYPILSWQ